MTITSNDPTKTRPLTYLDQKDLEQAAWQKKTDAMMLRLIVGGFLVLPLGVIGTAIALVEGLRWLLGVGR